MGKRKRADNGEGSTNGEKEQHCPSTIFVSNLSYSFKSSDLEEAFSEIGPVKRCFMVTQKGSELSRGFGFVKFAAVEDAKRAIELKNGSPIGGRKISVQLAMHRLPQEHRQQKGNKVCLEEIKLNNDAMDVSIGGDNHNGDASEPYIQKKKPHEAVSAASSGISQIKLPVGVPIDNASGSEKQRFARTVVFGGLLNSEMALEVFHRAGEAGTICSITYPFPKEELDLHGLSRDGCKPEAAAILFTSVKSACHAVALLHQQKIKCGCVWARQMGGEAINASNTVGNGQKSGVIKSKDSKGSEETSEEPEKDKSDLGRTIFIKNLPFDVDDEEVKKRFSVFGQVQSFVHVLHQLTKQPRGTAFLKFATASAADAAISAANAASGSRITVKGRWLKVLKALDNQSAQKMRHEESLMSKIHHVRKLPKRSERPTKEGMDISKKRKLQAGIKENPKKKKKVEVVDKLENGKSKDRTKKKIHRQGTEMKKQPKRAERLQNEELQPTKEAMDTSKKRGIEEKQKPKKKTKKKKKEVEVVDEVDKLIEQYQSKLTQTRPLDKGRDDANTSSGREEVKRWFE